MRLLSDIKNIFKKDYKLFILLNAIYFSAVIVGALIALAYPEMQMAMVRASGEVYGSGSPLGDVGDAYTSGNILLAASMTFVMNLVGGTILMMIIPSLIVPFWAVLFGVYRALIWGIMLIVPIPGVMPLSILAPHYLTILLEGEAYVIAIFACTRGLLALVKPQSFGTPSRLKAYWQSIIDNGKLLLVVALLLAIAATYEAWEVMFFAGILGGAPSGGQFGFYDEEFGTASSYSNWTQNIQANSSNWHTFTMAGGKLMRAQLSTNGTPVDVMVMDKGNFSVFNAKPDSHEWSAYVLKKSIVNETFDFVPPEDGDYWLVMANPGEEDAMIHMQLRYKK